MKILVFGFKPYLKHRENITEKVVMGLENRKNLKKIIFPVQFNKKMFVSAIERYKPDVILGLGMYPNARKIRIERRAINLKKNNKKEKENKIAYGGRVYRFVNLQISADKDSRVTYNTGTYVCNYSMYIMSELAEKNGMRFAFLHIPKDYDVAKIIKFIEYKIKKFL